MRLEPLDPSLLDVELKRRLDVALEFEGWQEAETIYAEVHLALKGANPTARARALMDHAMVLRRTGKEQQAVECEASAEILVGGAIEREALPKSSVDELKEAEQKKKGWFGWLK
jgi:hypothetical protein